MASKKNIKYIKDRIGQTRINKQGLKMEVIDYKTAHEMYAKFDDGTIVKCMWKEFDNGSLNNPNCKDKGYGIFRDDRLGEEGINNQGCKMKIIKYNNANDIIIQFDDNPNHTIKSYYTHFKNGIAKNPFYPSVYGVGIIGNEAPCMNGNEKLKEYRCWVRMIERCYEKIKKPGDKTYKDCWVCDEFFYYPNFYNWIRSEENYEVWRDSYNFALDKDILCKGNKIYEPDKCCLVPNRINNLIKPNSSRRGECVIGVFKTPNGKYMAQCWNALLQKNINLGRYESEIEAFNQYKQYKENLIKETADIEYNNGIISKKCRDALYKYKVEITD